MRYRSMFLSMDSNPNFGIITTVNWASRSVKKATPGESYRHIEPQIKKLKPKSKLEGEVDIPLYTRKIAL